MHDWKHVLEHKHTIVKDFIVMPLSPNCKFDSGCLACAMKITNRLNIQMNDKTSGKIMAENVHDKRSLT